MCSNKVSKDNPRLLGWKWYDFIRYVRLPISIITYTILSIIFILQTFTTFSISVLSLTVIFMSMLILNVLIIRGFSNKRKYAIYLYILALILYIILNIRFMHNSLLTLFRIIVVYICEIVYFIKRWDYFI